MVSFRRRTGKFVFNFLANIVGALRMETGGTLEDSYEAVQVAPARSNVNPALALRNDTWQQVETAMLNMIINPTAENG